MPLPLHVQQESLADRLRPLRAVRDSGALLVHEIYVSLQGESTWVGVPCTFVRLTGCHLRCTYCDTEHAFRTGEERSVESVVADVVARAPALVEFTGGEPLLQAPVHKAIAALLDAGRTVLIETSGGVSTAQVDPRARVILDVKTPGSGESERNVWANLARLQPQHDEVKLVITDADDYAFSRALVQSGQVPAGVTVLFSPAAPLLNPQTLAAWILRDGLAVRFQLQLHRVLWGDRTGV